jgi:hypothetical protein
MSLIQYVVPAIFAFFGGLALWLIKRDRKAFEYEIVASEPFPQGERTGKYFVIRLRNSGNTPVQDALLRATFVHGTVESARCSDQRLMTVLRAEGTQLEASFPLLNPGEKVAVTVTAVGDQDIPAPEVTARALGVTAIARRDDSTPSANNSIVALGALAVGAAVAVAFLIFTFSRERVDISASLERLKEAGGIRTQTLLEELKKQREESERLRSDELAGSPDSAQVVFALLNRAGVGHIVARLVETGDAVTYWRTGVVLVHSLLLDDTANQPKYVKALEDLVSKPMAVSSLGFNLYLLAKVESFRGNHRRAAEYLDRCKKEAPAMYQHLMSQDAAYDLAALQRELRRVRRWS